ncbi:uncharacterized protein LOC144356208 [Saccoglossus kowalevskii]
MDYTRILFLVLWCVTITTACPAECDCDQDLINCTGKRLSEVPEIIPSSTDFTHLRLEFNELTELHAGSFANLVSLRILTLYNNKIHSIEPGTFALLPQLRIIRLENNNLSSLTLGMFNGTERLEELELNGNRITDIEDGVFQYLQQLETLDLANNELSNLTPDIFLGLQNLQTLKLNGNLFSEFFSFLLPAIQVLDLSDNPITILESNVFENLINLQILEMNNVLAVKEGQLPIDGFPGLNVTELKLENNNLTIIPNFVRYLTSLEEMHLQKNKLASIPDDVIQHLPYLQLLDFRYNLILSLRSREFFMNSHLKKLWLDFNLISNVETTAFEGLTSIVEIDLTFNQLKTLAESPFKTLDSDTEVLISNNPWQCDCQLPWLQEWLTSHSNHDDPKCTTPNSLADEPIQSLQHEQLQCSAPNLTTDETELTIEIGNLVLLPCQATGFPPPHQVWYLPNGFEIESSKYQILQNGSLLIASVDFQDEGVYTCVVTNIAGNDSATLMLRVSSSAHMTMRTKHPADVSTIKQTSLPFVSQTVTNGDPKMSTNSQPSYLWIIGVVIIVAVGLVIICIVFCLIRRKRAREQRNTEMVKLDDNTQIVTNAYVQQENTSQHSNEESNYHIIPAKSHDRPDYAHHIPIPSNYETPVQIHTHAEHDECSICSDCCAGIVEKSTSDDYTPMGPLHSCDHSQMDEMGNYYPMITVSLDNVQSTNISGVATIAEEKNRNTKTLNLDDHHSQLPTNVHNKSEQMSPNDKPDYDIIPAKSHDRPDYAYHLPVHNYNTPVQSQKLAEHDTCSICSDCQAQVDDTDGYLKMSPKPTNSHICKRNHIEMDVMGTYYPRTSNPKNSDSINRNPMTSGPLSETVARTISLDNAQPTNIAGVLTIKVNGIVYALVPTNIHDNHETSGQNATPEINKADVINTVETDSAPLEIKAVDGNLYSLPRSRSSKRLSTLSNPVTEEEDGVMDEEDSDDDYIYTRILNGRRYSIRKASRVN